VSGKKSREKGKNGEREFANFLKQHGYTDARRGVQFKGTHDSPDVIGINGYHIEVKRAEKLRIYPTIEKAKDESDDNVPIVAHRKNRKEWIIVIYAEDFLDVLKRCNVDNEK